jgi:hypothetical protein
MTAQQILLKTPEEFKGFSFRPNVIIIFALTNQDAGKLCKTIQNFYPEAKIIGCSGAAQIMSQFPLVVENETVLLGINLPKKSFQIKALDLSLENELFVKQLATLQNIFPHQFYLSLFALNRTDFMAVKNFYTAQAHLPACYGGVASSARETQQPFVILDGKIKYNTLLLMVLDNQQLEVEHFVFHGWQPIKRYFYITKTDGHSLIEIDDEPALAVYQRYIGDINQLQNMINRLHLPIMLVERENNGYIPLAAALAYDSESQTIQLANQVKMEKFTFGLPPVNMVEKLADHLDQHTTSVHNPIFTLVFSCIARKNYLQQMATFEYYELSRHYSHPLVGFFTCGEIAPYPDSIDTICHNMTLVAVTIGLKGAKNAK